MSSKRSAILELFREGKRQCQIVRLLKVPQQTVSKAIQRFKQLGHEGDRPGRGRKPTVNTDWNRKIVKKQMQRNPGISIRKIARETGISRETIRRMTKTEPNPKAVKKRTYKKR